MLKNQFLSPIKNGSKPLRFNISDIGSVHKICYSIFDIDNVFDSWLFQM